MLNILFSKLDIQKLGKIEPRTGAMETPSRCICVLFLWSENWISEVPMNSSFHSIIALFWSVGRYYFRLFYMFLIIISTVSLSGIFVNKFSTSNEIMFSLFVIIVNLNYFKSWFYAVFPEYVWCGMLSDDFFKLISKNGKLRYNNTERVDLLEFF